MTKDQLTKANKIKWEIDKLESFIWSAGRVWTGKIIKEVSRYIFESSAYGTIKSEEYELDTDVKNRVLDVLREKLKELHSELESI